MIETHSAFIYGHTVINTNFYFGIDEGSGEILVELNSGSYSISDFADELGRALNEFSEISNNYNVSLDRATRKITISADNNFSILTNTSSQFNTSAYALAGFSGADKTGANSYTGDDASGSIYNTQFKLQKYVSFDDNDGLGSAIVNKPASNSFIEKISYGQSKKMECEIKYITDKSFIKGSGVRENLNGIEDARDFMSYLITGAPVEFIPDEDNPNIFTKCVLVKTPESSQANTYKLKKDRRWQTTRSTGRIVFEEVV